MQSDKFTFQPIGYVRSCYTEKFGAPRQAGLVPSATATIELLPPYNDPASISGLEAFSHIWAIFVFHKHLQAGWKPKVRPPRLGGNQSIGVFASRSSFRPNPIGLSALKLEGTETGSVGTCLRVSGQDLIEGTPVLDIKPYLDYADKLQGTRCGYANTSPQATLNVSFDTQARQVLDEYQTKFPTLSDLILETLALDPRPAYHQHTQPSADYGMKIMSFEVKFYISNNSVIVRSIT